MRVHAGLLTVAACVVVLVSVPSLAGECWMGGEKLDLNALFLYDEKDLDGGKRVLSGASEPLSNATEGILQIEAIHSGGGTSIGGGLRAALNEILARGAEGCVEAIVLSANGQHIGGVTPDNAVPDIVNRKAVVLSIGRGDAGETGGKFFFGADGTDLPPIFAEIQARVTGSTILNRVTRTLAEASSNTFAVHVDSADGTALFVFNGEGFSVSLTSPGGEVSDAFNQAPDVAYVAGGPVQTFRMQNAERGIWAIDVARIAPGARSIEIVTSVPSNGTHLRVDDANGDVYLKDGTYDVLFTEFVGNGAYGLLTRVDASGAVLMADDDDPGAGTHPRAIPVLRSSTVATQANGVTENLLDNPGFDGKAPWRFFTNGTGSFSLVGGEAAVGIAVQGSNTQLFQRFGALAEGFYLLDFDVSATTDSRILAILVDETVLKWIDLKPFRARPQKKHLTTTFQVPPGADTPNARFSFYMPAVPAGTVVRFDNVVLKEKPGVDISYFYSFTDQSGIYRLSPGETFTFYNRTGGCGPVHRDIAACQANAAGEVRAFNHDCLSEAGPGTFGPFVASGCSQAVEFGFTVECCIQ